MTGQALAHFLPLETLVARSTPDDGTTAPIGPGKAGEAGDVDEAGVVRRKVALATASVTAARGESPQKHLSFDEALFVAQSLRLAKSQEWRAWCKEGLRPPNVPAAPNETHEHAGWQGWGHWLGTGNLCRGFPERQLMPFEEALAVAQSLGLASQREWQAWCRDGMRPETSPSTHTGTASTMGGGGGATGWAPADPMTATKSSCRPKTRMALRSALEWTATGGML